jgi:hypothetical protein
MPIKKSVPLKKNNIWIKKILKIYQNINSKYNKLRKASTISDLLSGFLILLATIIFKRAFPALSADILAISVFVAIIVFVVIIYYHHSWALAGSIILLLFAFLALFLAPKPAQRGGVFIIVDLSENTQEIFKGTSISHLISLAMAQVPDNMDVGLMISGDPINDPENECRKITQIQQLEPKEKFLPDIQNSLEYLDDFIPQGKGNLEYTILEAMKMLSGREKNVQEIVVITSGLDERCDLLDRIKIEDAADRYSVRYALTILAVSHQKESVSDRYKVIANKYQEVELAKQIPEKISTIVAEPIFSYYAPLKKQ